MVKISEDPGKDFYGSLNILISMPVRVFLLKQIANEMLERTTGGKDSGLKPEDANKRLL